jgi:hypothetical protein
METINKNSQKIIIRTDTSKEFCYTYEDLKVKIVDDIIFNQKADVIVMLTDIKLNSKFEVLSFS